MNRHFASVSLAAFLFFCGSAVPHALAQTQPASALPRLVRFGGVVRNPNGTPLTGLVGVTFAVYSERAGGAPLWLETQNVSVDNTGHYSVLLGSTKPDGLPSEMFTSEQARWIGVQVSGQAEQPRVLLVSAPYALKAGDAETLGGLPPSAFMLAVPTSGGESATSNPNTTRSSAPPPTGAVTGTGTVNYLPLWDTTSDIISSAITQTGSGATAKIGIGTAAPSTTLDIKGSEYVRGTLTLPATSTASATKGAKSQAEAMIASVFNSATSTAVNQKFQLQAEPVGNNTATASGTLNLLYASGTAAPAETGLAINNLGQITFATGQTFIGDGSGLTNVTAANANELAGLSATAFAQLGAGNTFTGSQAVNGSLSASTGTVGNSAVYGLNSATSGDGTNGGSFSTASSAGTGVVGQNFSTSGGYGGYFSSASAAGYGIWAVNTTGGYAGYFSGPVAISGNEVVVGNLTTGGNLTASGVVSGSSFQIGSDLFAFGSSKNLNAFLGFAGNTSMTGVNNTATGDTALHANTSGNLNTANGRFALYANTQGSENTGVGSTALGSNITGSSNTALGAFADVGSANLSYATAIGAGAVVSESNALVLGGTGAAAVKVGIGTPTPASTLDVQGTGNFTGAVTFGAPVTFLTSQTFPNTITAVKAGTGLLSSGTPANVTLNLDTTKIPQLAAANAFTGNQSVTGSVTATGSVNIEGDDRIDYRGINTGSYTPAIRFGSGNTGEGIASDRAGTINQNGIDFYTSFAPRISITNAGTVGIGTTAPAYTLDVRGSGSFSSGVQALASAAGDAVFGNNLATSGTANGAAFYTSSPQGTAVVGVNSAGGYAGYFQGNVAVTGNVSIAGDTPMSHSPRMTFSGTVASFATSPQAAGYFIPDQPIVITRFTVAVGYGQTPYLCNQNEFMSLTISGNANAAKVPAPVGGFFYDSGALNILVAAGTPIYMYGNSASGTPGCQSGNNINATVEYVMQ